MIIGIAVFQCLLLGCSGLRFLKLPKSIYEKAKVAAIVAISPARDAASNCMDATNNAMQQATTTILSTSFLMLKILQRLGQVTVNSRGYGDNVRGYGDHIYADNGRGYGDHMILAEHHDKSHMHRGTHALQMVIAVTSGRNRALPQFNQDEFLRWLRYEFCEE